MDNQTTHLVITHFTYPGNTPDSVKAEHVRTMGSDIAAALKQLGNIYPAFTSYHAIAICLKTDGENANIISSHLKKHALDRDTKTQIFELAGDHNLSGFSELQYWL